MYAVYVTSAFSSFVSAVGAAIIKSLRCFTMAMFALGSQALFCAPSSAVLKHLIPKLGFFHCFPSAVHNFLASLMAKPRFFQPLSTSAAACGR